MVQCTAVNRHSACGLRLLTHLVYRLQLVDLEAPQPLGFYLTSSPSSRPIRAWPIAIRRDLAVVRIAFLGSYKVIGDLFSLSRS